MSKKKPKPKIIRTLNKKSDELPTIHKTFKSLHTCTSVDLRNQLETRYPEIWGETGNNNRSDEKRIKRALDKLVDFGLAKREKIGKEQIYTYLNEDKKLNKVHKIANEMNVNFNDMDTYYKRRNSIISLLNDVSDIYYIQTQQEDISRKEDIIKELESAIEKRQIIEIVHKRNLYKGSPLKIVQFDGFWYLILYSTKYFKYRIKDISSLEAKHETYQGEISNDLNFDSWHNIFHEAGIKPTKVKLFIKNTVFDYFKEKNILGVNRYKNRLTPCNDGVEYELYISHTWELLPTLMQWQVYVSILEQDGDIDIIKTYRELLDEIPSRLPL